MRMNLHRKSVLIIAPILFIAIAINSAVLTYISYDHYKQAVLSEATSVANAMMKEIDKVIALGMSIENIEGLSERLKSVTEDTKIGYAMILDMKGKILFDSDEKDVGKTYKDPGTLEALASNKTLVREWGDFYDIESPLINAEGEHVGMLRIGLVAAILKKELYKLLVWSGSIFVVLFFLFAAIIYFSVSRFITGPITKLGNAVVDIAKGNLDVKIEVTSEDEIGKLSESFNNMAMGLKESRNELLDYSSGLEIKVEERTAELHDNYFAQATINMILSESLENAPLEVILQKALNMILSVPWIALEPIGSIHLIEDDPEILVMKAQYNFPESQIRLCAHIPFGKCLCGRAAQSRKIEFADHIDERHEICYEGMSPHGHYIVPIQSGGRTLGVLNVYLKEGHIRNQNEEEFLRTIVDALAGIIMRKQAEVRIEYLAYYDDLTGLPNRNLFIDRLTQGIARIEYSKKLVAVLTIDIDKFKFINDTYGIEAGDAVLKAVAKKLTISVREGDTVARIGGDDFLVLLIDIAQSEDIILIVEKIMKNASQAIHFEGKEVVLTISVGISVHPNDGQDASVLIKNAEIALARAKELGRKSYQFYTEGMDIKASEFVQMEKDLFNAIKNEEFIYTINPSGISTQKRLQAWKP